jgi:pimeloyl-ACP methyl ester carboxylesterase
MLSYKVMGSGQPLLLIHGWGVTYAIWEQLAPLLAPHFQLIMLELPGIGNSPAADPARAYYACCAEAIDELRQHLGLQRWAVFSYSSGTRAAEAYLQRYPQAVSRAVFLCPAHVFGVRHLGLKGMIALNRLWPALTRWTLTGWRLNQLILFFGFNGRRHPRYTAAWEREIGSQRVDSLIVTLRDMPDAGRGPLRLPPVPALFIWGQQDRLPSRPRRLGPGDCLVPGMHSAPLEQPEAVAQAALAFLAQH